LADNEDITFREGHMSQGTSFVGEGTPPPASPPDAVVQAASAVRLTAPQGFSVLMDRADFERLMPYLAQASTLQPSGTSTNLRGRLVCFEDGKLPRIKTSTPPHQLGSQEPFPKSNRTAFLSKCSHCDLWFVGTP